MVARARLVMDARLLDAVANGAGASKSGALHEFR
jgi:hypothetical protein